MHDCTLKFSLSVSLFDCLSATPFSLSLSVSSSLSQSAFVSAQSLSFFQKFLQACTLCRTQDTDFCRWNCLLVCCLTSQQHASVSQGRICSDNFTCCHAEIEVADQAFYLTQSQYTDTGLTSPSADPITPDVWQGSHWSAIF